MLIKLNACTQLINSICLIHQITFILLALRACQDKETSNIGCASKLEEGENVAQLHCKMAVVVNKTLHDDCNMGMQHADDCR